MANKKKTPGKAVLVLGSGYGALKIVEDVAQSAIPVVWVTRSQHFLELPGGIEGFKEWPEDLNFQFRPLYLRVTRHPLVTSLTRSRIKSLKKNENGFKAVVEQFPMYIDYDLCTGCGRCMEVCPLNESDHPPISRTPAYCPSRALELDKRSISSCRESCPLGVNVQAYMALTAAGRFKEALAVIREDNPLPGVCGRICHHPCEASCRRSELDQPLAIRDIKRFLFDYEASEGPPEFRMPERKEFSQKVAVIGSGPSGLTAAYFLHRAGYKVTVFESFPEAGGMLRAGINAFRLSRKVLDAEIKALIDQGVKIETNTTIHSLVNLFNKGFKAVLLATGTHSDLSLNIPGEDLEGILPCVKFLTGVNTEGIGEVGARTVIIGGGNSSMDAARTALRLGSENVTVLAIEKEDEMPASPREVGEASEEGVWFRLGAAPIAFEGDGKVERVVCRPAHWEFPKSGPPQIVYDSEETFTIEADTVIIAIGQKPHLDQSGLDKQVETGAGGRLVVDNKLGTSRKGVFAAGDVVTGPSTVVESMAVGRRAASEIISYLTGKPSQYKKISSSTRGVGDYVEISEDVPKQPRQEMPQRQPIARRRDFMEVDLGFTTEQAMEEARRCLQCGSCCECRICETECADIGAIDHFRTGKSIKLESPAIIVANEEELPEEALEFGENIYRAENYGDADDLMDVLVAGSATAGQIMAQAAQIRSSSIPVESNVRSWPDETRLGFFLCTCNSTMAPQGALERIRDLAKAVPGIDHSELIVSACHPKGADRIAQVMREKKLSRVIMASCVCCPLEFQCISCNDQRNRARIHLFERHDLERSRFEMINLRDHLLSGDQTEDEIVERARDLLRAAFIRSNFMGPLRQGITEIGKQILVLGGSEVGASCAKNLALQGFKVKLVDKCWASGSELPESIRKRKAQHGLDRSITYIEEAEIREIRGHIGNFRVSAQAGGSRRVWNTDIICLTDENILPMAIHEDMMGLKKFYRYNFAFFHTPQVGLYRVLSRTLNRVSAYEAGAALAAELATAAAEAFLKDHQLSPRVDPERCRGCGRCVEICPFDAVRLVANDKGVYTSEVLHYNCVGCGGCVGRCPVTAMDMPYFSNQLLEEIVRGTLAGER
ncbi:MAG: FAD-dependent oxidoreductase [Deltaproteobacteria bacterium]|nr:FAD-dependent oxidoreductase [Deltaproteobacteria bacterium]MBW2140710.1 FAD-dependent oxidoreductase [Deltaproteobacteria bacterium]MBW2323136.1 FAD-dependent oxidoreductase [Deltaproteobacteria bacterium]